MTPAERYKGVVAALTEGFDGDAARGAERVAELRKVVTQRGRRLVEASEQHTVARLGNVLAWEDVLEILWVEQWMTLRPFPGPDRDADPEVADEAVAEVEARVVALRALVQRRGLHLPGR